MPRPSALPSLLAVLTACLAGCASDLALPDLPDRHGLGGMAAATVLAEDGTEAVLAAGGCNFPDGPPWKGGAKRYYRDVLLLSRSGGAWRWRKIGELPHAIAYAAFAPSPDRKSMIIAGGCDEKVHHSATWLVGADGSVRKLPSLPGPRAFAAGASDGSTLLVAGGSHRPDATHATLPCVELDLTAPDKGWRRRDDLGTWGILPLVGRSGASTLVASGCRLKAQDGKPFRVYGSSVLHMRGSERRESSLARPIVAAAGPGIPAGGRLIFVGGDDGGHYPRPPEDHPGLSRDIIAFDGVTPRVIGRWPGPLVTAPLVRLGDTLVTVGGEDRPGHRTAKVSTWTLPEAWR
ncbi:MAG: hypothetical protein ACO3ND_01590 [Opitutales bacterium]